LTSWTGNSSSSGCIFDVPGKTVRLAALEEQTASAAFWGDQDKAQRVLKEQSTLRQMLDQHAALVKAVEEQRLLLAMAAEEQDAETLREVEAGLADLAKRVRSQEL